MTMYSMPMSGSPVFGLRSASMPKSTQEPSSAMAAARLIRTPTVPSPLSVSVTCWMSGADALSPATSG